MKKVFKKNQLIITAMAVLIAVAGYLKYADAGKDIGVETSGKDVEGETNDPGEAILVSNQNILDFVINAKLQREQLRAGSKEELMEVVNNINLSEEEKKSAVDKMVEITEISEKELAAETLIMSKGYENVVVNYVEGKAEVIIGAETLEDVVKTQIEDIVKRKLEVEAENITITLVNSKK